MDHTYIHTYIHTYRGILEGPDALVRSKSSFLIVGGPKRKRLAERECGCGLLGCGRGRVGIVDAAYCIVRKRKWVVAMSE